MDETTDQIERKIREKRNDLGENFSELEEKVKRAVDWRAQFEQHPAAMVSLAFGGGILLSALLPTFRSSRRQPNIRWDETDEVDLPVQPAESRAVAAGEPSRTAETWDALKGALVGVAVTKLSEYVEEWLPGFADEFDKARSGNKTESPHETYSTQSAWQKSNAAGAD